MVDGMTFKQLQNKPKMAGRTRQFRVIKGLGGLDSVVERLGPRVRKMAEQYARKVPRAVRVKEDLEQAGMEGLIRAYHHCDPEQIGAFEAYAAERVRGAIIDELRDMDPLSRNMRRDVRGARKVDRGYSQSHGRDATDEELAEGMDWSVEKARRVRIMQKAALVAYFTPRNRTGAPSDQLDLLANVPAEQLDSLTLLVGRMDEMQIHVFMQELSPRHRRVIEGYYFEERTQGQIGEELGVTESRICQLLGEAREQLKEMLKSDKVPAKNIARGSNGRLQAASAELEADAVVEEKEGPPAPMEQQGLTGRNEEDGTDLDGFLDGLEGLGEELKRLVELEREVGSEDAAEQEVLEAVLGEQYEVAAPEAGRDERRTAPTEEEGMELAEPVGERTQVAEQDPWDGFLDRFAQRWMDRIVSGYAEQDRDLVLEHLAVMMREKLDAGRIYNEIYDSRGIGRRSLGQYTGRLDRETDFPVLMDNKRRISFLGATSMANLPPLDGWIADREDTEHALQLREGELADLIANGILIEERGGIPRGSLINLYLAGFARLGNRLHKELEAGNAADAKKVAAIADSATAAQ